MRLWGTARTRLLAGALVVLASSALSMSGVGSADAQPRGPIWQSDGRWTACLSGADSAPFRDIRNARSNITSNLLDSVRRDLSDLQNVNATTATLDTAFGDCKEARRRNSGFNIPSYQCAGEANLRDGVTGANAAQAYCNFTAAAILASRTRNAALESQAHVGRARALERNGGSQTDIADAYQDAIRANGNAVDARVQLAKYYTRIHEFDQAEGLLVVRDSAGRISAITGADSAANTSIALALVDLAQATTLPDKVQLLQATANINDPQVRNSVAVNSALGVAYMPNAQLAITYLQNATADGRTAEPGYEALQEQAFLARSVLISSTALNGNFQYGSLADAKTYSNRAGSTPAALRQGCLVRLLLGGEEVFSAPRDSHGNYIRPSPSSPIVTAPVDGLPAYDRCSRLRSTPEGQLLFGMFWLRHAQYLAVADAPATGAPGEQPWSNAVNNARLAFRDGNNLLQNNTTPLDWMWPAAAKDIPLRTMLNYGQDLAVYVGSICRRNDPGAAPAEDIFVAYKTIGPRWATLRCRPPA